ncbi:MAG: HIT family protein [Mariniphaga sp.]|nr:HIT family protein [Mariniphaga sp.]
MTNYKLVLKKFGFPNSLIKKYNHWYWLIRPFQVTLGSSILITKNDYRNFSDLDKDCFCELKLIIDEIEKTLIKKINYKKINYLMLMMNDPIVHFHIIPRYENERTFSNKSVKDFGYPGPPDLSNGILLSGDEIIKLQKILTKN